MNNDVTKRQRAACTRAGSEAAFLGADDRIAIGRDFDPTRFPINGLRHPPHDNMCGWYIWSGEEFSQDADYFDVICYGHLVAEEWPWIEYLALPAGWRFLLASGQVDMWFDKTLFKM